jgi:coniferyl-aldehyde dehydrogenase
VTTSSTQFPSDPLAILARQRAAFAGAMNPDHAVRDDRLARLDALIVKHGDRFADLISHDFGRRSPVVTQIAEIMTTRAAIRHARRHLKSWMRPRRVSTSWAFRPGHSKVLSQPLGVVGIIGAWNYPMQLALSPLVGALAAGNRAMVKPSELTPLFAEALQSAIAEVFGEDEVAVVVGGADVGQAFSALAFDHLIFTGSTRVGRLVAEAAAKNLTPVTLELGGKSPVIVDASADLATTADRVVWGKLFNAGQTCIAPDYALVPRSRIEPFVAALRASAAKQYPSVAANPDYTSIVNVQHHARIRGLIEDARTQGARVIELSPDAIADSSRTIVPTLLLDVTDAMHVMQEEIFGPVLPIVPYDTLDQAIAAINAKPRPLSLYWFGSDAANQARVLAETISGGVAINDTMMHFVQEDLPFGGVGPSGSGHYHGVHGFRQLSKEKAVFFQSRFSSGSMLYPPYTSFKDRVARLLSRWA